MKITERERTGALLSLLVRSRQNASRLCFLSPLTQSLMRAGCWKSLKLISILRFQLQLARKLSLSCYAKSFGQRLHKKRRRERAKFVPATFTRLYHFGGELQKRRSLLISPAAQISEKCRRANWNQQKWAQSRSVFFLLVCPWAAWINLSATACVCCILFVIECHPFASERETPGGGGAFLFYSARCS